MAPCRTIDDDKDSNNDDAVADCCALLLPLSTRFNSAPNSETADIASLSDRFTNNALIASSFSTMVLSNSAASPCEIALSHELTNAADDDDDEDDDDRTRTSFCSASGATFTSVVDDEDDGAILMCTTAKN